ncbi:uncharacterized protein LOC142634504 isoform X2 [Castanea sativa]|uniref:uncharacterized protein LOC142634504 isoform X2 n=1 Tax=Castanea sativa TaxID=21020 RepID=UPI003F654105
MVWSAESRHGTIVFLHGAPTQSYSYRVVMSEMSGYGFHCFAPDWIGFGISDKPQPGYGFDYTEKEFHEEFDKLLDVLGVKSPFYLVVQQSSRLSPLPHYHKHFVKKVWASPDSHPI